MAKQAQAAWVLLNDFNLDVGDPRIAKTFDGEHFQSWCLEYMQTLEQNAWLDQACLNQELISIISQNNLKQKQLRLFCVGFLDPTPAQLSLWQILQRQKHEIIQISEQNDINKSSSKIDFDHPDAELLAMAEFAKKHHASSKHQSLAFILPDLNQRYQNIDRVFRQTFKMPLAENHKLPFAISFGAALNKHALIETALLILGLGEKNSHDIINQLLLSPFLDGAEQESQARAQLTDDINQRPFSITLKQLTLLCEKNSPIFSSILCKFKPYKKAENTLEACLNSFIERLNGFGFPGQGMLTSHDFQVLNQFKTTLYDLMKLQLIQKPCSIYHALNLLRQACKDTLFQAESNLQANIHVLGLLEATDIPFDTVWQSGLSEKDWPQNHGINPFLPAPLQSELKMPGADPEHNTQFHETLIRNRIKSCHTFIASYISQENDVHVEATYCIKNVTTVVSEPPSSTEANSASKIEYYQSWIAPAVLENDTIRGGSQILRRQALCPFKAFAESRLDAKPLETMMLGLNYKLKGQILHEIMEDIWKTLQSQHKLNTMLQAQRNELITTAIKKALRPYQNQLEFYIDVEFQRIYRIVNDFLSLESTRESFSVIATEKTETLQLNKLTLHMRIDRIDQIETGEYVLIDYKTSQNSVLQWLGERPEEPQLPLYSLCLNPVPAALCFAELRSKKCKFTGIGTSKNILPQVNPLANITLDQLQQDWQKYLLQLSDDFTSGHAIIDPKNKQKTCAQCALKSLCRIQDYLQYQAE